MTKTKLADALGDLADLMFQRAADISLVWATGEPDDKLATYANEMHAGAETVTGWAQELREES